MYDRLIEQLRKELETKDARIASLEKQLNKLLEQKNRKYLFFKINKQPVKSPESINHDSIDIGVRKKA